MIDHIVNHIIEAIRSFIAKISNKNKIMKCFEVKLVDVNGNIYIQKLCCINTTPSYIFHAAWKSLYEGKHVAATILIDTLKEIKEI